MFELIKKRLEVIRDKDAEALLIALKYAPGQHLLADELSEVKDLRALALPLLARLQKKGLVEPTWTKTGFGSKLGYGLTVEGQTYVSLMPSERLDAKPDKGLLLPRPLLSKIAAWFLRTETS